MKGIPGTEYISRTKHGFMIQKYINKKMRYFYHSTSLIECLMVRDILIDNYWDIECIPHRQTATGEKYIYPDRLGYCIKKSVNGKNIHFGWYRTLEEAIKERDVLIECNWDFDALCNLSITHEEWLTGKYGKNQFCRSQNGRVDIRTW